uniref:Enhancer of mRNA-decapping protein 4 C-terminal domain-containing protein n=1 Tax=Aureoumbra lagunensis TaxID=44058 RepID=A0A7S3JN70_9STRA|mmetsp:Transcript_1053/g.1531  ORF Transcript_1053/g.1531 Transcript_1053/m.1531 type:complete len:903 (+) Transcript_1053:113-2821(+)|eukprot:CAMPEP_0197313226 /NCGR_PEP_ID=MMETSP0891-20130614/25965_1 /TAXON_ID=44058 ORGANISM="Aureoumbra lagunensis, Strain CCMP1510" /NCGR_SAMPLE_ID=MMETSP0891 /ASSEMBLY_ACC=CAM_ASM_000534 /LENGTH=902 /DNA_ID=CAMNT_0042800909 /DNA_START=72 /DNA_END=2783 /DNA_ORIENTATION=-
MATLRAMLGLSGAPANSLGTQANQEAETKVEKKEEKTTIKENNDENDDFKKKENELFSSQKLNKDISEYKVVKLRSPLKTSPVTLYGSDPIEGNGSQIAASEGLVAYAIKGGKVRVLNRNSMSRALLRGKESSIVDLALAPRANISKNNNEKKETRICAVGSDGKGIVWKIEYDEDDSNTEINTEVVYEFEATTMLRISWKPVGDKNIIAYCAGLLLAVIDIDHPLDTTHSWSANANETIIDIDWNITGELILTCNDRGTVSLWHPGLNQPFASFEDLIDPSPNQQTLRFQARWDRLGRIVCLRDNYILSLWDGTLQHRLHLSGIDKTEIARLTLPKATTSLLESKKISAPDDTALGSALDYVFITRGQALLILRLGTDSFDYISCFQQNQIILSFLALAAPLDAARYNEDPEVEDEDSGVESHIFVVQPKAIHYFHFRPATLLNEPPSILAPDNEEPSSTAINATTTTIPAPISAVEESSSQLIYSSGPDLHPPHTQQQSSAPIKSPPFIVATDQPRPITKAPSPSLQQQQVPFQQTPPRPRSAIPVMQHQQHAGPRILPPQNNNRPPPLMQQQPFHFSGTMQQGQQLQPRYPPRGVPPPPPPEFMESLHREISLATARAVDSATRAVAAQFAASAESSRREQLASLARIEARLERLEQALDPAATIQATREAATTVFKDQMMPLVPAFVSATNNIFKRLDENLRARLEEHDKFEIERLTRFEKSWESIVDQISASTSAAVMRNSGGASSAQAIPQQVTSSPRDIREEIKELIHTENDIDGALYRAVECRDVDILLFALQEIGITTVQTASANPIQPLTLICIIQQLGTTLDRSDHVDVLPLKLEWLQFAVLALDPNSPLIVSHVPDVLKQVKAALESLPPNLTSSNTPTILVHVINSLLK